MQPHYPCDLPVNILKNDRFGKRDLNGDGDTNDQYENHSGLDLRPHQQGKSKKVYATWAGTCINNTPNQGSYIAIRHGKLTVQKIGGSFDTANFETLYVHLRTRLIPVGRTVQRGQLLGEYTDHLHFTLRRNGVDVNPEQYFNFNQNIMNKTKLIQQINSQSFDSATRATLINAVNTDNEKYLIEYAGSIPRAWVAGKDKQIQELQKQLAEANKEPTKVEIVNDVNVELQNKVKELEKENQNLASKLIVQKEPFKPLEAFKSLMRDAYIQTFVGAIVTSGIAYATSQIPELQPLQDEITYTLLGILGIQAGTKQIEKLKNEK